MPSLLAPVLALAGALVLLLEHKAQRFLPLLAVVGSFIELVISAGVLHVSLLTGPVPLVLGSVFVVAGVFVYAKESSKHVVASATALAVIGLLQIATALNYRVL
jgi:hypothetical protein